MHYFTNSVLIMTINFETPCQSILWAILSFRLTMVAWKIAMKQKLVDRETARVGQNCPARHFTIYSLLSDNFSLPKYNLMRENLQSDILHALFFFLQSCLVKSFPVFILLQYCSFFLHKIVAVLFNSIKTKTTDK